MKQGVFIKSVSSKFCNQKGEGHTLKSIKTAHAMKLLSNVVFHFSIKCQSTFCVL